MLHTMQTHVLCIAAALPAEVAKAFTADRCVSSLFCSPEHVQLLVLDHTPLFFAMRDGPWFPTLRLLHQVRYCGQ